MRKNNDVWTQEYAQEIAQKTGIKVASVLDILEAIGERYQWSTGFYWGDYRCTMYLGRDEDTKQEITHRNWEDYVYNGMEVIPTLTPSELGLPFQTPVVQAVIDCFSDILLAKYGRSSFDVVDIEELNQAEVELMNEEEAEMEQIYHDQYQQRLDLENSGAPYKELAALDATNDPVNHPVHYLQGPKCECGRVVETLAITERFDFVMGNCLKHILRHQFKGKPLEDLQKAEFYLKKGIARLKASENV